jgi:hypothetical protein
MGGEPSAVTRLDPARQETGHWFPQFLPDGRHFIYRASTTKPEDAATYLGSLDSPDVKRIYNAGADAVYAPPGYLIFTNDHGLVAQWLDVRKAELSNYPIALAESASMWAEADGRFSVSKNGVLTYLTGPAFAGSGGAYTQLVWFDRAGKRLGAASEPAEYSNPAISPDGKKVAVGKKDPQTKTRDIWVIDLQRGGSSRLTFDPGDDLNPSWSPDGARIAFTSNRKGHRDLYVKPASGVAEEQLVLQSGEAKNIEDWSGNGEFLLYSMDDTRTAETSITQWLFSFPEHKSVPLLRAKCVQSQGRLFPRHGAPTRWIAYTSNEHESKVFQVYVRRFDGALSGSGGKWQISTNGGFEPYWRGTARNSSTFPVTR